MAEEAKEFEELEVEDSGFEDITGDDPVEDLEPEEAQAQAQEEPVEQEESSDEPEPEQESESVETTDYEQPVDDGVVDDSVMDDESTDEVATLREQNEALLAHVESLSGQLVGGIVQPPVMKQMEVEAEAKPEADIPTTQAEVMNFLENTSIDDLLEDPSKFNAVLNQVSQQAESRAEKRAVQRVLRSVPELVMGYITRHSAMNRMVDDFYKENSDLVNVKQTVAAVANDIHAKSPDLGVEDVFKQSAERTRKLLGLKKQAAATKRKPTKPAFAKSGGARQVAPQVDPIQREINDLLKDDF